MAYMLYLSKRVNKKKNLNDALTGLCKWKVVPFTGAEQMGGRVEINTSIQQVKFEVPVRLSGDVIEEKKSNKFKFFSLRYKVEFDGDPGSLAKGWKDN